MGLTELRQYLLKRIKDTEELFDEHGECEFWWGVYETLVDVYNQSFKVSDKRMKRWKCKICGHEEWGVIQPAKLWPIPETHKCEFVVVFRWGLDNNNKVE